MSDYREREDGRSRRDALYEFVVRYKTDHGGATPSVREMARALGTVPSVIHFHLRVLADDGRIRLVRGDGRAMRHIAIPGETWVLARVPR